jgi:hypothetical protein
VLSNYWLCATTDPGYIEKDTSSSSGEQSIMSHLEEQTSMMTSDHYHHHHRNHHHNLRSISEGKEGEMVTLGEEEETSIKSNDSFINGNTGEQDALLDSSASEVGGGGGGDGDNVLSMSRRSLHCDICDMDRPPRSHHCKVIHGECINLSSSVNYVYVFENENDCTNTLSHAHIYIYIYICL